MEKQILIPIVVVLGLLTCGIGIYIYIRCNAKPVETLREVVITEKINKDVENSIDNSTNVCNNSAIPACDTGVIGERKEDPNNFFGLVREYKDLLQKNTDQTIADLQNLRAGCAEIVQAGNGFIEAGNNRIEAGNRFIAHCDNMIQGCNNSIVFGTLALGMSAVSVGDETNETNLDVG